MADSEALSRRSGNPTASGTEPLPRIALPAAELAPFMRSKDRYGKLSNMTGGFPLTVAGTPHSGPERLYQALKFPNRPDVQQAIGRQPNGMAAKKRAYRPDNPPVRPDWDRVKPYAMMAALATKLRRHPDAFAAALMETSGRLCVEVSYRDSYWGAKPRQDGSYAGHNVLGRMLTELRRKLEQADGDAGQAAHAFLERIPDEVAERLIINGRAPWTETAKAAANAA